MTIWTVKTHYKKSCQEVERWRQDNGDGQMTITNGFRFGEWSLETTDDKFPEFEFTEVPGGDGRKDSLDMCSYLGNNIDNIELNEMFDGGCWFDIEIEGLDEEEEEKLREFLEENSQYDLEGRDGDSWYNSDTEWWIWGPIEVINDDTGESRIICADEEGKVVDFVEE